MGRQRGSGRRGAGKKLAYPALLLGVLAADQIAKYRVETGMKPGEMRRCAQGRILIRSSRNRGAALNVGQRNPALVRRLSVVLTAAATLYYFVALAGKGRRLRKTGLSLLLGGAYSNTYDRLVKKEVTDYVSFDIGSPALRRIVFNLGDFGVIAGAGMVAADGMLHG